MSFIVSAVSCPLQRGKNNIYKNGFWDHLKFPQFCDRESEVAGVVSIHFCVVLVRDVSCFYSGVRNNEVFARRELTV